MAYIVLLGDSISDNNVYTGSGARVIELRDVCTEPADYAKAISRQAR